MNDEALPIRTVESIHREAIKNRDDLIYLSDRLAAREQKLTSNRERMELVEDRIELNKRRQYYSELIHIIEKWLL